MIMIYCLFSSQELALNGCFVRPLGLVTPDIRWRCKRGKSFVTRTIVMIRWVMGHTTETVYKHPTSIYCTTNKQQTNNKQTTNKQQTKTNKQQTDNKQQCPRLVCLVSLGTFCMLMKLFVARGFHFRGQGWLGHWGYVIPKHANAQFLPYESAFKIKWSTVSCLPWVRSVNLEIVWMTKAIQLRIFLDPRSGIFSWVESLYRSIWSELCRLHLGWSLFGRVSGLILSVFGSLSFERPWEANYWYYL